MKEIVEWSDASTGKVAFTEEHFVEKANERKEGGGIWNRSRAPHCYGFEYEKHFGHVCKLGIISKEHEAIWRKSSHWPNVPPVDEFYTCNFVSDCLREYTMLAEEQHRKLLEERKRKKKKWQDSYNIIRKNRRRKRAEDKRRRIEEYKRKEHLNR